MPTSGLKSETCIVASSEYRQPVSKAPRTRLRNAGSHAFTSRTHSASVRYLTLAVSVRGLNADPKNSRNQPNHRVRAILRSRSGRELAQAFLLDRANLLAHYAQTREMAVQFRARVLRQRSPFRGAQAFELLLGLAQCRLEGANAQAREDGLHLVHDPGLLSDKILPLPVRSPCILLLNRRDRHHAAMALLAPQPAEKGAHQEFRIEAIGLRAPVFARHRDARGVDDINFDIAFPKPAREPEAVATGLIGNHDALDLTPSLAGFIAPTMQKPE